MKAKTFYHGSVVCCLFIVKKKLYNKIGIFVQDGLLRSYIHFKTAARFDNGVV